MHKHWENIYSTHRAQTHTDSINIILRNNKRLEFYENNKKIQNATPLLMEMTIMMTKENLLSLSCIHITHNVQHNCISHITFATVLYPVSKIGLAFLFNSNQNYREHTFN